MVRRKGMGKGTGKGYKNLMGSDKRIHSQSAKGVKQPQKIHPLVTHNLGKKTILTEQKIETNGKTEIKLMLRKQTPLMTAKEIFTKKFGAEKPNVMTPKVEGYGKLGRDIAYELASGDSLFKKGKRMFGVTIVKLKADGTVETLFDHSKAFQSRADADKYIKKLKESKDSDKDGIPDVYDCDSTDPTKQDDGKLVEIDEFVAGLDDRNNGDNKVGFGSKLKSFGKKVGEGIKKTVAEQREKQRKIVEARKIFEAKELKRPEHKELEAQEKRVKELRHQREKADDPEEFSRLEGELEKEEYQLNEKLEKITTHKIEDYSDKELKTLAVRHRPDSSIFGFSSDNPYKSELLRRIESRRKLNQDIKMTQKGQKQKEQGGDDILAGIFGK